MKIPYIFELIKLVLRRVLPAIAFLNEIDPASFYPAVDIVKFRLPGFTSADIAIAEPVFNDQVDKSGLRLTIGLHIHSIVVRIHFLLKGIKNICQG
jgi:hypothetical protein